MPRKATNKIDTVEEKVVKKVAKKETKKAVTKKEPAKKVNSSNWNINIHCINNAKHSLFKQNRKK